MILRRTLMESGNADDKENHFGKDKGSIKEVDLSALH